MDTIYRGDAYPLSVAWTQPDPANPAVEQAANPLSAKVTLVRERDGKPILTNEAALVTTNVATYLIDPTHLVTDGAYAAYLTATFADGNVQSKRIAFLVTPRH